MLEGEGHHGNEAGHSRDCTTLSVKPMLPWRLTTINAYHCWIIVIAILDIHSPQQTYLLSLLWGLAAHLVGNPGLQGHLSSHLARHCTVITVVWCLPQTLIQSFTFLLPRPSNFKCNVAHIPVQTVGSWELNVSCLFTSVCHAYPRQFFSLKICTT